MLGWVLLGFVVWATVCLVVYAAVVTSRRSEPTPEPTAREPRPPAPIPGVERIARPPRMDLVRHAQRQHPVARKRRNGRWE